ncbi:MAG: efflux RND transporter periplasmic adaptor subunit [Pseudomonadota bacterium]
MYNNSKLSKQIKSLSKIILVAILFSTKISNGEILESVGVVPAKIISYNFQDQFTAVGQCKLEKSKTYHAKVDGTINSISIIQGKNVSKGDVLITIDSTIAKAQKSKAEASFESAKSIHERDLSLLAKKIISKEVSDKSKVALEIARADLANANNTYNNMIITAPFDGYVGVVHARTGDDVKMGDYLFSLIANGNKTIFVELPETLFGKIDKNSEIFALDIDNNRARGSVLAVSNYLNDNGTITAKLAFPYETKIMHGSYIETQIIFNKHRALGLPEKTILKNNKGNFVYAISEENKIKQIYVQTGTRTDNMIEIISDDLKEGDLVVLEGLTKVYEGVQVQIIEEENKT